MSHASHMTDDRGPQPARDAGVTLMTLGGFALHRSQRDAGDWQVFGPGKPLALIAYLAAGPGRTADRDQLVDLLWSDLDPDAGRHALRQAIWHVRHRLGEDAIAVERNGPVRLMLPISTDCDAFAAAIRDQKFEDAVKMYRGDFLPGFAVPGGGEFEYWVDVERSRLRLMFLRAAEMLVRRWLSQARFRDAERLARQVRDTDPARDAGWRLLLEALLSSGDRVAASAEAEALERRLVAADREPEPATRKLIRLARDLPEFESVPKNAGVLLADLIGREREFSTVVTAWEAVRRGRGQHVHLRAAPGLGKTRLLTDLHARLRAAGARVIGIRANPGERRVEFAFAADLANALASLPGATGVSPGSAGTLVSLNPSLSSRFSALPDRTGTGETLRRRAIALGELLAAVADEAPFAVLLDDVHWSDGESRQVLQALLDHLPDQPALVVSTSRPSSGKAPAATHTVTMDLEPLNTDQVRALITSISTLPEEPWAEKLPTALQQVTAGSPLLIIETLQLALERGLLERCESGWGCGEPAALANELATGGALRQRVKELEPGSSWLLLILAVAGTPVATSLLAVAAGRPISDIERDLEALEQRGLICRTGHNWRPGHDELSDRVLELATPEARRAAHGALGMVLAATAGDDASLLHRAALHLGSSGGSPVLDRVFRRCVVNARRRGDRRPVDELAASVLGDRPDEAQRKRLVRSLPLRTRMGLDRPKGRITVGIALAWLGATAVIGLRSRPTPAIHLVVVHPASADTSVAVTMPLYRDQWDKLDRLDVGSFPRARRTRVHWTPDQAMVWSPDGRSWVTGLVVSDSGELELFLIDESGASRRLTHSPGDDASPTWSPDGQRLAFSTVRWNPRHHFDLALLDMGSGKTRALTRTDDSDHDAAWSPDGSRIAFTRQYWEAARPPALCWISADGRKERCFDVPSHSFRIAGWRNEKEILLTAQTEWGSALMAVETERGTQRVLDSVVAVRASWHMSPDGRWIACLCERPGYPGLSWFAWPTDSPDRFKWVRFQNSAAQSLRLAWRPHKSHGHFLDTLRIATQTTEIPLDALHRLQAMGRDPFGQPVATPVVSWSSSDTAVAVVDSTGSVHPRQLGHVTVHASAGGWRAASVALTVREPNWKTVLGERWTGDLEGQWMPFGVPRPVITSGPRGVRSFWHHGDSTYHSGAYSRRQLDARQGLGMETRISTPVDALQWQMQAVALDATFGPNVGTWDHVTGGWPQSQDGEPRSCGFQYPQADGFENLYRAGTRAGPIAIDSTLRTGRWYTIRLQIFPDGRCGVGIDGRAIVRSELALALDRPFRVVLYGKSVQTRMLVGPVEVWEGVRTDVDWSALDRR